MSSTQIDDATRRAYSANITRFYVYKFLTSLQLWMGIWVLYLQRERGLSLTEVTLLDAPFWLVIVLAEVPTGAVADRWGRKLSLALGGFSFAAAIFVFGVADSFWGLLASYLIWGVSQTLASGADSAFLYESLAAIDREDEFRKVMGRTQACFAAAGMIGAVLGAPLAAATSLSFPIVLSAAIALAGAVVVLTFREPEQRDRGPQLPYQTVIAEAMRYSWTHAPLRAMLALRAVLFIAAAAGFIFVQPFLADHDVPVGAFGLLGTPASLAAVAGSLVAYRLAARLGERNLLWALTAVAAGGLLVLAAVSSVLAFLMFSVLSFSNAVFGPLSSDFLNRHSPSHLRATIVSVGQMVASLVIAVAEPSLGAIADHASLQLMFLVTALALAGFGALALAAWTAATRAERTASTPVLTGDEGRGRAPEPVEALVAVAS